MTKEEIKQRLQSSHQQFIQIITGLPDEDFLHSGNGKWTAGQQLEHILKSVMPVNQAFKLSSFFLKMLFGKPNRPSRTYDGLVEKYQSKLALGGRAPGRFVPSAVSIQDRDRLATKLQSQINSLVDRIDRYSEKQLDMFILPHPLLGKLTLREMLYFTIYHVGHHQKQVVENLKLQPQV